MDEKREKLPEKPKNIPTYASESQGQKKSPEPSLEPKPTTGNTLDAKTKASITPPRNPNHKLTTINMERSISQMLAEHREVIRRAMR